MTEQPFILDEERLEDEARSLAAQIIADDQPARRFAETLARTGSPGYCEMLVSQASSIVALMAVQEDTPAALAAFQEAASDSSSTAHVLSADCGTSSSSRREVPMLGYDLSGP